MWWLCKVVGERTLVAEEPLKDLKALTAIAVSSLEASVILPSSLSKSLISVFVKDLFEFLVSQDLVGLTELVECLSIQHLVGLFAKGM